MIPDAGVLVGSAVSSIGFLGIYLIIRFRQTQRGLFLPDSFLFGLILFSTGGMVVAWRNPSMEALTVAVLGNTVLLSGVIGCLVAVLATSGRYHDGTFRERLAGASLHRFDRMFAIVAGCTVAAVTLAFIYLVLTGPVAAVFRSLAAFVSDGALLDVRKAIASGREGYLAPGYVKQFRDVLGPILLVYLGWQRSWGARSAGLLLLVLLVLGILLSGQRAPLLILVLCILVGRHFAVHESTRSNATRLRRLGLPLVASAAFLALLTGMDVLLGRTGRDTPLWSAPGSTLYRLVDRAVVTVPRSNVTTFDLWMPRGPTLGESWIQDFTTLLPEPAGELFSNVLHQAGGGSAEGNLVLGMAPDLWLAWGWPGVLLLPLCFAACVVLLDVGLYRSKSRIALATRVYLFFALPMIYSPYGFVLYGGSVALIILALLAIWRDLSRLSTDRSEHAGVAIRSGRWPPGVPDIPSGA